MEGFFVYLIIAYLFSMAMVAMLIVNIVKSRRAGVPWSKGYLVGAIITTLLWVVPLTVFFSLIIVVGMNMKGM